MALFPMTANVFSLTQDLPDIWEGSRAQFLPDPDRIHIVPMLPTSPPKPVRDVNLRHGRLFDMESA